jgi:putative ABC transport system ATP-binding protein
MGCLIEMNGVDMNFGQGAEAVQALCDVNLSVAAGCLTLLMGPSGSGKTTLLSIMGCIMSPTRGRVSVCGCDATGLSENALARLRLKHIGFVFQSYNLLPTLTVSQNVRMALRLKGVRGKEAKERAAQALAEVGLAGKTESLPRNLSGGQKQRVAIARALAGDHDVILADEPTASLDSHSGQTVLELLRGFAHERGYVVVVVTHDPRALPFADRIVAMEDGHVVRDGAARLVEASKGVAYA